MQSAHWNLKILHENITLLFNLKNRFNLLKQCTQIWKSNVSRRQRRQSQLVRKRNLSFYMWIYRMYLKIIVFTPCEVSLSLNKNGVWYTKNRQVITVLRDQLWQSVQSQRVKCTKITFVSRILFLLTCLWDTLVVSFLHSRVIGIETNHNWLWGSKAEN